MKLFGVFNTDRFQNPAAKGLYSFAWMLEVVAVILGLAISFAIFSEAMGKASDGGPAGSFLTAFVSFAPFFMVALSELAKIPIAEAAYSARNRIWQYGLGIFLIFLALITFETVFNGLERNFTVLQWEMDQKWNQLQDIKEKIGNAENRIGKLNQITLETIEKEYNDREKQLHNARDARINSAEKDINRIRETGTDQSVKGWRTQVERKIKQRDAKQTKLDVRNEQDKKDLRARRAKFEDQLHQARAELTKLGTFKVNAKNTKRKEIDYLQKNIKNLNLALSDFDKKSAASPEQRSINDLDKEIDALEVKITQATGKDAESLQRKLQPYTDEKQAARADYKKGAATAEKERKEAIAKLDKRQIQVEKLEGDASTHIDQRTELCTEINTAALQVQVYRLALRMSGERYACNLEPEYVTLIGLVWFGSLSAVVALTGVLVALGAFVVEYGDAPKPKRPPSPMRKLLHSVRRAVFNARKFQRREKVVTKIVTEPKEVIVKELVHVPVLVGGEHKVKTETMDKKTGQSEVATISDEYVTPATEPKNKPGGN